MKVCLDFAHFVYQGISQERIETLLPISRHHQVRQAADGVMQAISYEGTTTSSDWCGSWSPKATRAS